MRLNQMGGRPGYYLAAPSRGRSSTHLDRTGQGVSPDALVREAVEKLLVETPGVSVKEPTRSLRDLLAKYGPGPSAEEIDQNRAEMFANFPRADF
jgi:hypothetical protein